MTAPMTAGRRPPVAAQVRTEGGGIDYTPCPLPNLQPASVAASSATQAPATSWSAKSLPTALPVDGSKEGMISGVLDFLDALTSKLDAANVEPERWGKVLKAQTDGMSARAIIAEWIAAGKAWPEIEVEFKTHFLPVDVGTELVKELAQVRFEAGESTRQFCDRFNHLVRQCSLTDNKLVRMYFVEAFAHQPTVHAALETAKVQEKTSGKEWSLLQLQSFTCNLSSVLMGDTAVKDAPPTAPAARGELLAKAGKSRWTQKSRTASGPTTSGYVNKLGVEAMVAVNAIDVAQKPTHPPIMDPSDRGWYFMGRKMRPIQDDLAGVKCFACNEVGHVLVLCPKLLSAAQIATVKEQDRKARAAVNQIDLQEILSLDEVATHVEDLSTAAILTSFGF